MIAGWPSSTGWSNVLAFCAPRFSSLTAIPRPGDIAYVFIFKMMCTRLPGAQVAGVTSTAQSPARRCLLPLQYSLEYRQHQRGRHKPGGPQRQPDLWSARDHRPAAMLGGLQRIGDHPLGRNMGESRQLVHQVLGVVGGLK